MSTALTYSKLEVVNPEDYTPEKCWAAIEHLADLLNIPGKLQHELKLDPKFGPKFKAENTELAHLLVDSFDVGDTTQDDSVIDRMAELMQSIQRTQFEHLVHCISIGSTFMQCLPINQILLSIDADDEILKDMTPKQLEEFEALKSTAEFSERQMSACKMDPRIAAIVSAGIKAAGGQTEFAAMQMNIVKDIPEEFKENPSLHLTAQLTGALSRAIVERAGSPGFNGITSRSAIEYAIALKQVMCMPLVAAFHCSPEQILDGLQFSTKRAVMQVTHIDDESGAVPEKPAEASPASTMFAGNETVN